MTITQHNTHHPGTAALNDPAVAPWWWSARELAEIRAHLHNPGNGLDGLDPVRFGVALSLLPINHPVMAAARLAVDTAHARHDRRTAHRDTSRDLAAAFADLRIPTTHIPYPVLAARRAAVPHGHVEYHGGPVAWNPDPDHREAA